MNIHGRRIRLFRNGDPYFTGKKIIISPIHHRIYEQFLIECSKYLDQRIKNIYTVDGLKIKDLSEFQDGVCYVASSGDAFRKIQYNDSETGPSFMAYSKPNMLMPPVKDNPLLERKKTNASAGGLLSEDAVIKGSEETLFMPDTKAFRISIYENGNFNMDGVRIILNHRNCKSFDQLMKYFSSMKIIKSGQVRKLYDAGTGKRIRHLSGIENGMNIALSAFDPFKKGNYKLVLFRNNTTAGISKREEEIPRIIKVFPNGDAYHNGVGISVIKRNYPNLQRLMEKANTHIELVTGMIKKMYTTDGVQIMSIDEIQNGRGYVVVSNNDPFIKTKYDKMDLSKRPGTSYRGLQGHTLNNTFLEKIRPITKRGKRGEDGDSKPIWNRGGKRLQTSRPVETPAPPRKSTKIQVVVGDGMETEETVAAVEDNDADLVPDTAAASNYAPGNSVHKRADQVVPAPPFEEAEIQSESAIVELEQQSVSRSPKTAARAKTAKPRPKTTAAKFEQPDTEESLPPLIRESSVKSKGSVKKMSKEESNSSNIVAFDDAPNTQPQEILEDEQLNGDSGKGEEELFQSESIPVKVLESASPTSASAKKKGWFGRA